MINSFVKVFFEYWVGPEAIIRFIVHTDEYDEADDDKKCEHDKISITDDV